MDDLVSITVTTATTDELGAIARMLVAERLVACANIVPIIRSVYRWEDAVHEETEALAVLHTRADLVDRVFARIRAVHPYQTPQILAVPIIRADPAYAGWVRDSTVG